MVPAKDRSMHASNESVNREASRKCEKVLKRYTEATFTLLSCELIKGVLGATFLFTGWCLQIVQGEKLWKRSLSASFCFTNFTKWTSLYSCQRKISVTRVCAFKTGNLSEPEYEEHVNRRKEEARQSKDNDKKTAENGECHIMPCHNDGRSSCPAGALLAGMYAIIYKLLSTVMAVVIRIATLHCQMH